MLQAQTHRLFLALVPPLQQRDEIYRLGRRVEPNGSHVRPDRLHATIAISEDNDPLPGKLIEHWLEIGSVSAAKAFPFTFALGKLSSGYGPTVFIPSDASREFHDLGEIIDSEMELRGIAMRRSYKRSPHVTLVYPDTKTEPFTRKVDPIQWEADELVLIHSHVGVTRHDLLGRWRLSAERPQLEMAL